jgi:hypothetical protein
LLPQQQVAAFQLPQQIIAEDVHRRAVA